MMNKLPIDIRLLLLGVIVVFGLGFWGGRESVFAEQERERVRQEGIKKLNFPRHLSPNF